MTAIALRTYMPPSVAVLVVAVGASGFAAAMVESVLWWLTPAMASTILLGWLQARSSADPDADPVELPGATRRIVRDTIAALPPGEASELLRSIIHPARSLFENARLNGSLSPALLRDCTELVEVSCETSAELGRLEQLLATEALTTSAQRRVLHDGAKSSSAVLRDRLTDAARALARLYVQSIERGSVSSERVAELARDLNAEVSVRRRANSELEALLR